MGARPFWCVVEEGAEFTQLPIRRRQFHDDREAERQPPAFLLGHLAANAAADQIGQELHIARRGIQGLQRREVRLAGAEHGIVPAYLADHQRPALFMVERNDAGTTGGHGDHERNQRGFAGFGYAGNQRVTDVTDLPMKAIRRPRHRAKDRDQEPGQCPRADPDGQLYKGANATKFELFTKPGRGRQFAPPGRQDRYAPWIA